MSEKFKIDVVDVQAFLRSGGLRWDKTILTKQGRIPATRLKDLALDHGNPVAIPTIDRSNNLNSINIAVNQISFVTYVESFYSDIDAVLEFDVENDFSNQWINFLVKRYGKDYQEYAEKFCKHERSRIVLDTYAKVKRLDAEKRAILDEHKSKLNKYDSVSKLLYSNNSTTLEKK